MDHLKTVNDEGPQTGSELPDTDASTWDMN